MPAKHPSENQCPECGQPQGFPCIVPSGATLGSEETPVHHTGRVLGRPGSASPQVSAGAPARRAASRPTETAPPTARPTPSKPTRASHAAPPPKGVGGAARGEAQPALF